MITISNEMELNAHMDERKALCIHIPVPFTSTACRFDVPGSMAGASRETRNDYLQAVNREMRVSAQDVDDYEVVAIVFSGGPVQAFLPGEVTVLTERIKRNFHMAEKPTIILTCDPYDIDPLKAANYRQLQVDMMDIRLFSSVQEECKAIGRGFANYSLKEPAQTMRHCLLHTIGVQVGLGIPGQTRESLAYTLAQCGEYEAVHVSLHALEEAADLHAFATQYLTQQGYECYAPDRFAKAGWAMAFYPLGTTDVLGLGLGAISMMDGIRSCNTTDLALYLNAAEDYTRITASVESL